jgi:UPF0755 protein
MKWTLIKWIFFAVLTLVSCGFGIYQTCELRWNTELELDQEFVSVEKGDTLIKLINHLSEPSGLSDQVGWIKLWLKFHPEATHIKVGTYKLGSVMSPAQIAALLSSGKVYQYRITLVEGETFAQWWAQLNQSAGIVASSLSEAELAHRLGASESKLEGLLLPETYYYTHNTSAEQIVKRAYEAMQTAVVDAWQTRQTQLPLRTPYELLILASIVEKETGLHSEREQVASVFVNRLRQRMRLQTDPTIIYGLGERYDGRIRSRDIREATPYNTYVIRGLPPTPIAMPSLQSIHAAAHPIASPYYYFVANGDGGHHFSKTLAEHNRAVKKYILNQ